ncbi:MAG: hypothetical protein Q4F49_04380 [Pseudoxanthomonas suwonensis]|nr:hypothetical protein [Pseudoxanthomonas suwonensis]
MTTQSPLDPTERALADRLAADRTPQPSAALDARILAAARAAAGGSQGSTSTGQRPRARTRWPLWSGVAASIALALGIAWQLRPLPGEQQPYDERPPAVNGTPAVAASDATPQEPALSATPGESTTTPEAAEVPPLRSVTRQTARPEARPPAIPASTPPPVVLDDDEAVASDAVVLPPAPPVPAARVPAASSAATETAEHATSDDPGRPERKATEPMSSASHPPPPPPPAPVTSPSAPVPAAPPTSAPTTRAGAALPTAARSAAAVQRAPDKTTTDDAATPSERTAFDGWTREQINADPPATVDDVAVQLAWLQRVRELMTKGRTHEARSSLAEFVRRYPHTRVPEDLKPLLAKSVPEKP